MLKRTLAFFQGARPSGASRSKDVGVGRHEAANTAVPERARIPVALVDLDDLVKSLLDHYERLDIDAQRLIPLRKLYWPT